MLEAKEQVRAAKCQLSSEGGSATKRMKKARLRAAEDRRERVQKALRQLDEKRPFMSESAHEPRVSTTDPDTRRRKLADRAFRPAYNRQLATDVRSASELVRSGMPSRALNGARATEEPQGRDSVPTGRFLHSL